jgi:hypothetical protein
MFFSFLGESLEKTLSWFSQYVYISPILEDETHTYRITNSEITFPKAIHFEKEVLKS